MHLGVKPLHVMGDAANGVSGVRFTTGNGQTVTVQADAVALGYHLRPETQLADLARRVAALLPGYEVGSATLAGPGALARALAGQCTAQDAETFRGQMLTEMARMSLEDGLVMQIHPGAFRNHSHTHRTWANLAK